jgi:hypothetical protein
MSAHQDLNVNAIPIQKPLQSPTVMSFTQTGDPHVFLVGRPPLNEYLGFIRMLSIGGADLDNATLTRDWRLANDRVRELEEKEADIANDVERQPVSSALQPLVDEVMNDPTIQKSYSNVPWTIEMVKLDTLVVYQKHINLSYVEELKVKLGPSPDEETIFRLCFPLGEALPSLQVRRVAPGNVFSFVSPSNDLRFLDATFLPASQINGYATNGRITGVVALAVGFGCNCFNVVSAEGRLILNNASHRAFALRDLGITHAPCIIQHVSREEEFPVVLTQEVVGQIEHFLSRPRPPLLKDYFDDQLRRIVNVPKQNRHVRITFMPEAVDL